MSHAFEILPLEFFSRVLVPSRHPGHDAVSLLQAVARPYLEANVSWAARPRSLGI